MDELTQEEKKLYNGMQIGGYVTAGASALASWALFKDFNTASLVVAGVGTTGGLIGFMGSYCRYVPGLKRLSFSLLEGLASGLKK